MTEKRKQQIATICLMLALFFSPLGVDALQLSLIELTGSLWKANLGMYCLALLFFILYIFFLHRKNQKLANLSLSLTLFCNPFGFDIIQFGLIQLTGTLLRANFVMYCIAISFFGLHFKLSGNNPITEIKLIMIGIYDSKIAKFFKK